MYKSTTNACVWLHMYLFLFSFTKNGKKLIFRLRMEHVRLTYALASSQERGKMFIGSGAEAYKG